MPYHWTQDQDCHTLTLWPHRSMTRPGFVWFMGSTLVLLTVPLFALLGSLVLWGILAFEALAVGLLWLLIARNWKDREIRETLTVTQSETTLHRENPRAADQDWACNTYWVQVRMHESHPHLPHYVTLSGNGREVEIGAFLAEDERLSLHDDLQERFAQARQA